MVKSKVADVEIPSIPVHHAIMAQFAMFSARTAIIDGLTGESWTYEQLLTKIRAIASAFVKLGAQRGQILALISNNCMNYVAAYYGAFCAGMTVTFVNPDYTTHEIHRQLRDAEVVYVLSSKECLAKCKKAGNGVKHLQKIILLDSQDPMMINIPDLMMDDGSQFPENMKWDTDNDIAILPYSSGTTGLPKGVMITHRNIMAIVIAMAQPECRSPDAVVGDPLDSSAQNPILAYLPFYHAYGIIVTMTLALAAGERIVILPMFQAKTFLDCIQKYKIKYLPVVPPVLNFLNKHPLVKNYDLSSLERVGSGAAPLASETEAEFFSNFKIEAKQGFGMTETTGIGMSQLWPQLEKPGTVGRLICNTEAKIIDGKSGKSLGSLEHGELLLRGPQIMKGYWNRPAATKEAIDSEGWLHTGDIGYYDDDNYFFIVDRAKELIKFKGFQVAPAELEALLLTHPGITDAAVIGIPDRVAGEVPKAFVVARDGVNLSEDDIFQFVKERVTKYKWLTGGVEFLDVIPKSQTGKILRRELRKHPLRKSKI